VSLLNEFYFDAPSGLRARILSRNEAVDGGARECESVDGPALVEAARTINGAFAARFASTLSVPATIAKEILTDASGQSLAVACKGAGLDRAAFSAIALLTAPELGCERLSHFDAVPRTGAERLLDFWRGRQN
jgi:hypothetical protein